MDLVFLPALEREKNSSENCEFFTFPKFLCWGSVSVILDVSNCFLHNLPTCFPVTVAPLDPSLHRFGTSERVERGDSNSSGGPSIQASNRSRQS
jgi:hypothetical protein